MMRLILLNLFFILFSISVSAQVGASNMNKMNALMTAYGAKNVSLLKYESKQGFVHQVVPGFINHYTINEIKKIAVQNVDEGATVSFYCADNEECINHIANEGNSGYLASVSYYFFQEDAANKFASLAAEIIQKDFKSEIVVSYTSKNAEEKHTAKKEVIKNVEKKKMAKPKRKKNHLSIDAYNDGGNDDYAKTLSPFGKKINEIYESALKVELGKFKAGAIDGVFQSNIKLPKATKNYISEYKGGECFIAEFGTKKYYEDLQDMYDDIRDEIEDALPEEYEPVDMAFEKIYENSDDEVFHTEYYSTENADLPSIVIRITPDGKQNTLFLRVGKK